LRKETEWQESLINQELLKYLSRIKRESSGKIWVYCSLLFQIPAFERKR
jgi:hypothetical protein